MKKRSYRMFVEDVLESIEKIELYIDGLDYENITKNLPETKPLIKKLLEEIKE